MPKRQIDFLHSHDDSASSVYDLAVGISIYKQLIVLVGLKRLQHCTITEKKKTKKQTILLHKASAKKKKQIFESICSVGDSDINRSLLILVDVQQLASFHFKI